MSEELVKPGERAVEEMEGYIRDLLDVMNDILAKNKRALSDAGISSRLGVLLGVMTMHRYNPDLFMQYWNEFKSLVEKCKAVPTVKDRVSNEVDPLIAQIEALKSGAGL
ncbi:hypothetical protein [Sulfuracidifex tepidarius]|uniref:Uncharacterized protein n=1 Tax=Sulfuracidifex tepidarius TaxID=1294262 RepID=A0A510DS30_9CREN|nr:hypothetical protein [Sulfuracidifex tepidarius]BBG22973.1 hypothetical protein IC006_0257 [Sulfuracidifex tepidarius]BBG25734.1 hypothetical protein IC007_0239 [Sulfuracidifex tepidarius]